MPILLQGGIEMKGDRLLHITLFIVLSHEFVPFVFASKNFCLEFETASDTKVVAKHSDSLNITREITMESWIYPKEVLDRAMVLAKFDTWNLSLHNLVLQAAINSAKWAHDGGGEVELNKWSHVAVSFDTKEFHTFVNGKHQVSISNPGAIKPSNKDFYVGWSAWQEPFSGLIDEVRISNVARYTKGKNFPLPAREFKPDKNTVVLYHFNEEKGIIAKDESEYKNDGEVIGAKWVKSDVPIGPAAIDYKYTISTTWSCIKTH
jgi:hypothetical protein